MAGFWVSPGNVFLGVAPGAHQPSSKVREECPGFCSEVQGQPGPIPRPLLLGDGGGRGLGSPGVHLGPAQGH